MFEKIENSSDQATGKRYTVIHDATLDSIAAGFDADLSRVFARKMLADMEKAGFGPKPEDRAAVEEGFYRAYLLIDELKPAA